MAKRAARTDLFDGQQFMTRHFTLSLAGELVGVAVTTTVGEGLAGA